MNWTTFFTSIGISAVAIPSLAWLSREIIGQFLAKDLEVFKGDLKKSAYEHEVRFKRLQEKQAEIIAEFYKRMVLADASLKCLEGESKDFRATKTTKMNDAYKWTVEAYSFFAQNEVWFSMEISNLVRNWYDKMTAHAYRYDVVVVGMTMLWAEIEPEAAGFTREEWEKSWMTSWKGMKKDIPELLERLKKEFRGLLGAN